MKINVMNIARQLGMYENEVVIENLIDITNFVDELFMENDEDTVKKLLVCVIHQDLLADKEHLEKGCY